MITKQTTIQTATLMKRLLILASVFACTITFASIVILFDPATGRNLTRVNSTDTLRYLSHPGALINPLLPTNDLAVCKVTNGAVVPLNAQELAADALAAWQANSNAVYTARMERINAAKHYVLSDSTEGYVIRGMLFTILGRMNALSTNPTVNLGGVTTNQMWLAISNAIVNDPL